MATIHIKNVYSVAFANSRFKRFANRRTCLSTKRSGRVQSSAAEELKGVRAARNPSLHRRHRRRPAHFTVMTECATASKLRPERSRIGGSRNQQLTLTRICAAGLAGVMGAAQLSSSLLAADPSAERFWPQWRGPYASGVSRSADPPLNGARRSTFDGRLKSRARFVVTGRLGRSAVCLDRDPDGRRRCDLGMIPKVRSDHGMSTGSRSWRSIGAPGAWCGSGPPAKSVHTRRR